MKGNILRTAEDLVRATDPHLRVLYRVAKQVFLDRNAVGITKERGERAQVKAATRPLLRKALGHARIARDAIFAGDATTYELQKRDALLWMERAATRLAEVYKHSEGQSRAAIAKLSSDGGAARRIVPSPELVDLIKGYIERNETPPVAEWIETYNVGRSWLYALIKELRSRQK